LADEVGVEVEVGVDGITAGDSVVVIMDEGMPEDTITGGVEMRDVETRDAVAHAGGAVAAEEPGQNYVAEGRLNGCGYSNILK
jgi:hypothetical protein